MGLDIDRRIIGASLSEPHTSEANGGIFIGASLSEPHTSEPNGGIFIFIYIYLSYVVP